MLPLFFRRFTISENDGQRSWQGRSLQGDPLHPMRIPVKCNHAKSKDARHHCKNQPVFTPNSSDGKENNEICRVNRQREDAYQHYHEGR